MKTKKVISLLLAFILLVGVTHLVHRQIRGNLGAELPEDVLYLPQGQYVKVIALGFDSFMADLLWVRSLQYFGGHFMYDRKYPIVDRLLEVITTLEPRFVDVYSFGAMVLHEEMKERDKAVKLLDRGIENNPQNWHLPYELGFLWFEELQGAKDSTYRKFTAEKAMQAYSIATTKPDCPDFISRIVVQMYYEADLKDMARNMWAMRLKEAEDKGDELSAQIYTDKLLKDKFQMVAGPVLQKAVLDYYKKYKKAPEKLTDLIKEGYISKIPLDPITGGPLMYDSRTGKVYSKEKPQFSALQNIMKQATVLIVDDEKNILTSLTRPLSREGYNVKTTQSGKEALEIIKQDGIDLMLLDVWLPDIDGLTVLQEAKGIDPDLVAIVMSGHGTIDTAVKATKLGAFDFMEKPLSLDKILLQFGHALKYRALEEANKDFRQAIEQEYQIIGNSMSVKAMLEKISRVAATPGRVLITGENGTGKELVARAIHLNSTRKEGPFIKVNCAAIPNELIESELFGHEKGSFTGATDRRKGKFELADGGTIFLDEIGDMSFPTQAKILRVLTDNEIDRVGGAKPIKVDVRVIAATNKNLEDEIKKGNFREDLYYRLNVVPFYVLPLRQRKEDIPLLAEHFLKQYCKESQSKARRFDESAVDLLKRYQWPGNVRELKNIVERAAILSPSDVIGQQDISSVLPSTVNTEGNRQIDISLDIPTDVPLKDLIDNYERSAIIESLKKYDWNVTRAAESLGLERSHLYKKMRAFGINREPESNSGK